MNPSLAFSEVAAPVEEMEIAASKRRFRWRWWMGMLAFLGMLLAGFGAFVATRGGADFEGDLAQLLPPDTAFFVSMNNMGEMLDRTRQTSVLQKLTILYPPSKLLVSDHDLKVLSKSGVGFTRARADATFNPFLRRWFGREVVVAMLPTGTPSRGCLIALARTDAGFEENLAELVTTVWMHSRREKSEYRGTPMTLFRGDDPGQSIGYCRFGKTIAVSVYEDSFEPLKAIIDRREGGTVESLATIPEFSQYSAAWKNDQGASAFIRTNSTFSLLKTYSQFNFDKHPNGYANFQFFDDVLRPAGILCASLGVKSGAAGETLSLRAAPLASSSTPVSLSQPHRVTHLFAGNTMLYAGGRSDHLSSTLRQWTLGFPQGSFIRDSSEKWNEVFNHDFGIDLEKDLIPKISGEMGLGLIDFRPSVLVPQVRVALMAHVNNPDAVNKLLESAFKHYQSRIARGKSVRWNSVQQLQDSSGAPIYKLTTVYGDYACTVSDGYLCVLLPEGMLAQVKKLLTTENPPAGIRDSPLLAGVPNADELPLLVAANTRALAVSLKAMGEQWSALSKNSKEDFDAQRPMLNFLEALGSMRITRQANSTVEVAVPLQ